MLTRPSRVSLALLGFEWHARQIMKRLTEKRKRRLRVHAACQAARTRQEKLKRLRHRRRLHASYISEKSHEWSEKPNLGKESIELALPADLSLTRNYDATVGFIKDFRHAVSLRPKRMKVDFTSLQDVSPAAALVLAAELDRWRLLRNFRPRVIDIDDWNPEVRRLLDQMGLFELLRVSNRPVPMESSQPKLHFIKFCTGDEALGSLATELRVGLESVAGSIDGWKHLYAGLQEAMTNVMHHAYPKDSRIPGRAATNRWWMAGSYDQRDGQLQAMFFDQGVGIPNTVPRTLGLGTLMAFFDKIGVVDGDAERIKAAMTLGRTRTKERHRGKGLHEIREYVATAPKGRLRILSGRGEYIYNNDGTEQTTTHPYSIGGTLIQWEICRTP